MSAHTKQRSNQSTHLLHQVHGPAVHEEDRVVPRVVVGGLSEVLLGDAPRPAEGHNVDAAAVLLPVEGEGETEGQGQ